MENIDCYIIYEQQRQKYEQRISDIGFIHPDEAFGKILAQKNFLTEIFFMVKKQFVP
jgi:hypothetical protein